MLKFFFNRHSRMVKLIEIAGLIFTIWFILSGRFNNLWLVNKIAFCFYIFEYVFIRVSALIHWHKEAKRGEGIELQLIKAMVPTSYILAITGLLLLAGFPAILLYFSITLLLIIAHVNVVLFYLLIKDTDTTPINYFSHNKYLS